MSFSLILASTSPRRKEILKNLGLKFSSASPTYDENTFSWSKNWERDVQDIALCKAQSVSAGNHLVLAADTIVVTQSLDTKSVRLGKPQDMDQARYFISLLQGTVHAVYTGIALKREDTIATGFARTLVKMRSMSLEQQSAYLQRINPLDKAGGYAVQDAGVIAIEQIEGCESNVRGLPIDALHRLFQTFKIDLFAPPATLCI